MDLMNLKKLGRSAKDLHPNTVSNPQNISTTSDEIIGNNWRGGDLMIKREYLIIAFLGSCLFAALLVGIAASANVYNPLADVDCDGDVDVGDQRKQQLAMFTYGDPVNLTLLDALKPVAMGVIGWSGNVYGGYNVASCAWDDYYKRYNISITGVNYYYEDYVTVVTPSGEPLIANAWSVLGNLQIQFLDPINPEVGGLCADFQFVTYEIPTL